MSGLTHSSVVEYKWYYICNAGSDGSKCVFLLQEQESTYTWLSADHHSTPSHTSFSIHSHIPHFTSLQTFS